MDALETLTGEHAHIVEKVKSLDEKVSLLPLAARAERHAGMGEVLEACREAWQEILFHIQKEEEALYHVLEQHLEENAESISAMKCEHGELLSMMLSLLSDIVKSTAQLSHSSPELVRRIQGFRKRLSEHIDREEKVVFWLADLKLSAMHKRRVTSRLLEISRTQERVTFES